jgi:hypothetical protein
MYPRSHHLLSLLLLAGLGACAAPTEEDAVEPAGATSAATAKSSVQHTFVMHEGIAPAFDFTASW